MRGRIVAAEEDVAAAKGTAGADHNREAMAFGKEIGEAKPYSAAGNQRWNHHDDCVARRFARRKLCGYRRLYAQRPGACGLRHGIAVSAETSLIAGDGNCRRTSLASSPVIPLPPS